MIYVGIDIAKTNHYASIVNYSTGEVIANPFLVTNNKQGFELLYSKIKNFDRNKILIGLESTAHYGNNLIFYFNKKQFKLGIINPLQTATLRKTRIRKVKNDKVDSMLICEALSLGYYNLLSDYDIKLLEIKSLCRFHKELKDKAADAKIQLISFVDQLFPELSGFFKDNLDIKTAHELLKLYQSPEDISRVNLTKLSNLLISSSRGKYDKNRAIELKNLASNSIGINNYALSIQIKMTIELIELLESQIKDIEKQVNAFIKKSDNVITSIPGIGDMTAAIIISEIGDINRFNNPGQVLAFAGLDPSVKQSGNFNASSTRMSKRGSSLLRYALILAANNVQLNTKTFNDYYNTKRLQGKLHYNALGHCAGKLVRNIFYMLKYNVKFNLN
jgi:transposase